MAQGIRNELNLYEEAKAGLFSLIQQTAAVFLGFVLMLLVTGGTPSGFVIALSFCLGTALVSWSEQKRVRNLKEADSSIPLKDAKTESIVTEEQLHRNSSTLDIQNSRQQRLLEELSMLEDFLRTAPSEVERLQLQKRIEDLMIEIDNLLERE